MSGPWLVVIDPQRIFADPDSDWGSPMWADAVAHINDLLPRFAGRTILRWGCPDGRWPPASRPAPVSR